MVEEPNQHAAKRFALALTAVLGLAPLVVAQSAPCTSVVESFLAVTPAEFDRFGSAVAFDGGRIAVGVPGDDQRGVDAGSVHLYVEDLSGWVLEQIVLSPFDQSGQLFGSAVALDGGRLVVGAPGSDGPGVDAGAVYVFELGAFWELRDQLIPADLEAGDLLGASVALDDDLAAIGAPGDDDLGFSAGAVHVYRRGVLDWSAEDKLTASDGGSLARFGSSVSASGPRLVIGADLDSSGGFGAGAAYVFERPLSTWLEFAKLTAPVPLPFEQFGSSVALDGDVAVVGVPSRSGGGAEIFERIASVWTHVHTVGPGSLSGSRGASVAIRSPRVLLGEPGTGLIALAVRDALGWVDRGAFASSTSPGSRAGSSVALVGDQAVVGAPGDVLGGFESGAVNFVQIGSLATAFGMGSPGTSSLTPSLTASGCVGIDPDWTFTVESGASAAPGFLLFGATPAEVSIVGIELLVGGPIMSIVPHVLGVDGTTSLPFTWLAPPTSLSAVVQALYQDPGAAEGWSATNGLQVQLP